MNKGWKKNYDRINRCFDGELCIFGDHYSKKECLKIIEEDNYDDPDDYKHHELTHSYIRFGFVHYEGEITNGWSVHDEPKKGRIKCTILDDFAYCRKKLGEGSQKNHK